MLIYEYKNKRTTNELFSQRQVIDETHMDEDQVIIYYPRKILDTSRLNVACVLTTQFRAKIFRDRFLDELERYISTFKCKEQIIKGMYRDKIDFYNNSIIRFVSSNNLDRALLGVSITNLIVEHGIDVQDYLYRLRPM